MITVPSIRQIPPNFRPIRGLTGRGLGDDCSDFGICLTDPVSTISTPIDTPVTPITGDFTLTPAQLAALNTGGSNQLTAAQLNALEANTTGNVTGSNATSTTGTSAAQILASLAQGAGAGATIYKSLQTPSLIPGTNLVYNPASGQLQNATGVTATALTSSISSLLPLMLMGGLALLVFSSLKK